MTRTIHNLGKDPKDALDPRRAEGNEEGMSDAPFKTLVTTFFVGPPVSAIALALVLVPLKEIPAILLDVSFFGFLISYAFLSFLSALIALFFAKMGEKLGRLPFWLSLLPPAAGFILSALLYVLLMNDLQGPVHGAVGVVVLPFGLLLPMSILSWLCVVRFWRATF
jgi:hypothetical protein